MSDNIEVELMVLPRSEYEHLQFSASGIMAVDIFPTTMFVLGTANMDTILEVAPRLTSRMRALGFRDE